MFAALLMAHGTPETLDEMPAYLTLVRGGRPPSDALVEEMRHNYAALGGQSPLTDITGQQAVALAKRLGPAVPVFVGMRNWRPFIADALAAAARAGVRRVLGIPMAPQFSTLSVQEYIDAARAALPDGIEFACVEPFFDHPLLIDAFAARLREACSREGEEVIFTAHSLPERVIRDGDPYARQVAATAAAVAARGGLERYRLAYQSAGRTPEPWIGPELGQMIRELAAAGARSALVAPIGFLCDHTEVLFDIDVQAAALAREAGIGLRRTESLNTSPLFIELLASLVEESLRRQSTVVSR